MKQDLYSPHTSANWRISRAACAPLLTAVLLLGAALVAPTAHGAIHYQRLKSFPSIPDDGAKPHAGLMEGSDGALYGTTFFGGTDNAGALCLLGANTPLTRAFGSPPVQTGQKRKSSEPIPWSEIGARVGAQYQGDGLAIVSAERGAVLRCLFQKLEGEATTKGLWLTSTAAEAVNERFRVVAVSVGRDCPQGGRAATEPREAYGVRGACSCSGRVEPLEKRQQAGRTPYASGQSEGAETVRGLPIGNRRYGRLEICATGTVEVSPEVVRFIRPGMVEEYSVSMDGVRQDFVIAQKPAGAGELRVELDVEGARAETGPHGARLVLEGSGRKIAYSRLRVADAEGRALNARIEVVSAHRMAVRVEDAAAVYPVRIDPTFSDENWISMNPSIPGANSTVVAAAVDGSGNLYIGGGFTVVGDVIANRIAKWNGSAWSALGSGLGGGDWIGTTVYALAVSGGDLYVGGNFTTAGGNAATNIAKWDGSAWTALSSGLNGPVYALAVSGSDLYAGGAFGTAGGNAARNIAKWNGSAWMALGSGLNDWVHALAVSGGNLYVGGQFTTAGGNAARNIAKWNGSAWTALGSGLNSYVTSLAVSGGDLYVGGFFTTAGGNAANHVAKWNGSVWTALGSGLGGYADALAVSGGDLYVGGSFTTAGGNAATNIAKWNGSAWTALGSGIGGDFLYVLALAVSGSDLYVGGQFTTAGGNPAANIAKWDGSAWTALAIGSGLYGGVEALAVSGSDLYVAGFFTTTGGNAATNIAKWNGSAWAALGSGLGGYGQADALAVCVGDLYVGGGFTTAGGNPANNIAKWNGSAWTALGSGLDGQANALAVSGGDLYVGGRFTTAGGNPANYVAKWDGSAWSALGSGLGGGDFGSAGTIRSALAVSSGDLYVGGVFTTAGGNPANYVAKWNGSGWTALGSGLNDWVNALAVSGSDLYAGGWFTTAGGNAASHIAKWDGSAWTALGSGLNGLVNALAVSGSDLYVGGGFTTAGGNLAYGIAKWDGSGWTALGSGLNGVTALALSGSDLYVGGYFTTAGGKVSAYLAKANISPLSQPGIVNINLAGTDVVIGGTNGPAGAASYALVSTNVALPLTNWTRLATNRFDGSGNFTFTNGIAPNVPQQFYLLQVP